MSGKQLRRLPFFVLLSIGGLTAVVFVISGCVMTGGFERAWETLVGIRTPFEQASGLGLALSALGYIAVPTVIGVAAGAAITQFTNKRLSTVGEAVDDIRSMAKEKPERGESNGQEGPDPG